MLAPFILDSLLKNRIPEHGIVEMAFTEKDLYPKEDWNYIFGLGSYGDHVGVSSIYRLQKNKTDSLDFSVFLERLMKVSSHEIGHMLSMHHCIHARCVMNGSNSLGELDFIPVRLCSECQEKLHLACQYDNRKRLNELLNFFKRNKLAKEYNYCLVDKESLGN